MTWKTFALALLWASTLLVGCGPTPQDLAFRSVERCRHSAVVPAQMNVPQVASWYGPRHEAVNQRLRQGHVDLLFIGDSITNGWDSTGKEVWDRYYAPRNAVNMGFGWDRTQHVLWRLDHSDLTEISPRLAIVMIGTNNSGGRDNTAAEIADGIITICKRLRARLPRTKILLLAIFPRDLGPSPQRDKNAEASLLASRIADGRWIHYLDINQEFLTPDGRLSRDIMPDFLHPNKAGYEIWAKAIESKVKELMGERE